ncbi:unnamed protein product [Adineta ricciae]|uniref:FH2 domain-containing protein n=1 Tax=Adineta ricciae TaxID=249248 RepID=A0A814DKD6_ADIRI|nr:unnamed protein product [Adineta ricciae]
MLTPPMTTINQYSSETDDVFIHESLSQSPSDGFVGFPPPPPPPAPPVFINTMANNCQTLLPQQEVQLVVNPANVTEIQARSIPSMLISTNNIWTRRTLPNLRIKQTVFDQHFGDTKSPMTARSRRASVSTSSLGGGGGGGGGLSGGINDDGPLAFVLLDATSKMLYDVPMRHLLQLVKKDYDDDASIDHVIQAIDETRMKSEWLDAVTALNKQFDKRPEDKARVLAHKGSTHGLVLIEQFFVKLVRVPAYEFKLIYLKFREEAPTQLERMGKHIHDLLESIQTILTNEQLPGILHLLCLLYNSITGKTVPGLHFDSLLSVLSTRTLKQNTTIAHLLCQTMEEQYPTLLDIFENQILLKLKDLSALKYVPIYLDIRLLYNRYKQLNSSLNQCERELVFLPEHIKTTLNDLQVQFTKLFDDENQVKKGEKDLTTYFCLRDLPLETCLSTLGQCIDKLRLSHMQNLEQRRRNQLLTKQRTLHTPSRSLRNIHESCSSDTNIFRDHLNVPLTPIASRQRYKVNRIARDRFSSSRDVDYDEQPVQNLLPNATPKKRGCSPTPKTVLTKRPFNVLKPCTTTKLQEETSGVLISSASENELEDTNMDCSMTESTNLPTPTSVSACENQLSGYVTTPIRHDSMNPIKYDQRESIENKENDSATELTHWYTNIFHQLWRSTFINPNVQIRTESRLSITLSEPDSLDENSEAHTYVNGIDRSTVQPVLLNNQQMTKASPKRTSVLRNPRSTSTHNVPTRNILRCPVSRRFSTENPSELNSSPMILSTIINRRLSSSKSQKPNSGISSGPKSSSTIQPLRAVHMSTVTTHESPKIMKRPADKGHSQTITMSKFSTNRTTSSCVVPSFSLI